MDHSRGQNLSEMMDDSVFPVVMDIVAEEGSIKCETVQFKAGSILCLVCSGLNTEGYKTAESGS